MSVTEKIWIVNGIPYAGCLEGEAPRRRAIRRGRMIASHTELFFEQLSLVLAMLALAHVTWLVVIGLAWLMGSP